MSYSLGLPYLARTSVLQQHDIIFEKPRKTTEIKKYSFQYIFSGDFAS